MHQWSFCSRRNVLITQSHCITRNQTHSRKLFGGKNDPSIRYWSEASISEKWMQSAAVSGHLHSSTYRNHFFTLLSTVLDCPAKNKEQKQMGFITFFDKIPLGVWHIIDEISFRAESSRRQRLSQLIALPHSGRFFSFDFSRIELNCYISFLHPMNCFVDFQYAIAPVTVTPTFIITAQLVDWQLIGRFECKAIF